jgi:hypothetical protein
MTSVAQKITNRIRRQGRGWVFTPRDFLDLASRSNADVTLHRLAQDAQIRHLGRGLYDYPKQHPKLGTLSPTQQQIVDAVARATGDRIWPTGASAANDLGLTTQVPARPAYVTTGKPKTIRLGDLKIQLRKAVLPRTLTHFMAYMTLQALDNMGPRNVDQEMIEQCAKKLTPADKKDIQQNLRYIAKPWLAYVARQLAL